MSSIFQVADKIFKKINLKFRIVKIIDLIYIGILYFIFCFYTASFTDGIFYKLYGSNDNNASYILLLLQTSMQFGFNFALSYIIRNVVQLIPYPFNKYYGYDRSQLFELIKGPLITTFLFLFEPHLQQKVVNLQHYATIYINKYAITHTPTILPNKQKSTTNTTTNTTDTTDTTNTTKFQLL